MPAARRQSFRGETAKCRGELTYHKRVTQINRKVLFGNSEPIVN